MPLTAIQRAPWFPVRHEEAGFIVVVADGGGAWHEVEECFEEERGVRGFGFQIADLGDVLEHEEKSGILPAGILVLDGDDAEMAAFPEEIAAERAIELIRFAVEECASLREVVLQVNKFTTMLMVHLD